MITYATSYRIYSILTEVIRHAFREKNGKSLYNIEEIMVRNIGVPKEIKNNENRVVLTPGGVLELQNEGRSEWYKNLAWLAVVSVIKIISMRALKLLHLLKGIRRGDMIVKVKEPIEAEYGFARKSG